jgi:hypothetical protein
MSEFRLLSLEENKKYSFVLAEYTCQLDLIDYPCKKALAPKRSKRSPTRTISHLIGKAESARRYQPLWRTPFKHVWGAR